jgi:hypothetical protein
MNAERKTMSELTERTSKWRKALSDAATGPLIIASEVCELSDQWSKFSAEAAGLSCTQWLKTTFGKGRGLGWFRRRARAVSVLGEACRRRIHHNVAVWLVDAAPDETSLAAAKQKLFVAYKANGDNALTEAQAKRALPEFCGQRAKKGCENCAALLARIAELESRSAA